MIGSLFLFLFHTTTFHIPIPISHIVPRPTSYPIPPVHPAIYPMAHFTTALLGSFSRLLFPSSTSALGLAHSKSDPDLAQHIDTHLRPASSTSVRPRPASAIAIEGYWGWSWDSQSSGTTLRRRTRTERDVGLKVRFRSPAPLLIRVMARLINTVEQAPADVKITDASPVLCQPPRPARPDAAFAIANLPADAAAGADVANTPTLKRQNTTTTLLPAYTLDRHADSQPDLSFLDVSLVSDTSASSADASFELGDCDISGLFTLDPRADSEFDTSLEISLIADTSTSSSDDESSDLDNLSFGFFAFPPCLPLPPPPPPSASGSTPSTVPKPIGLGLTNLYTPSGAPFDGLGVLSFGVCRAGAPTSPSPPTSVSASSSRTASAPSSPPSSPSRASHWRTPMHPASHDRLSRTFLEEAAWTWAEDPEHHHLTVIEEAESETMVWVGAREQDAEYRISLSHLEQEHVGDICGDKSGSKGRNESSRTRHRIERDTISSGLKRSCLNPCAAPRSQAAAGIPGHELSPPELSDKPSFSFITAMGDKRLGARRSQRKNPKAQAAAEGEEAPASLSAADGPEDPADTVYNPADDTLDLDSDASAETGKKRKKTPVRAQTLSDTDEETPAPAPAKKKARKKAEKKVVEEPMVDPSMHKLVLVIPQAASDGSQREKLTHATDFDEALDTIYTTIGCADVPVKPVLSYRLSNAPAKAASINLTSEKDWEGCLAVTEQYLMSLRAKSGKGRGGVAKGKGKAKMPILDLEHAGSGDDDFDDGLGIMEKETKCYEQLQKEHGRCQLCGPSKACKINVAGEHHQLNNSQLKSWARSLAAETHNVTLKAPPKAGLFKMFFKSFGASTDSTVNPMLNPMMPGTGPMPTSMPPFIGMNPYGYMPWGGFPGASFNMGAGQPTTPATPAPAAPDARVLTPAPTPAVPLEAAQAPTALPVAFPSSDPPDMGEINPYPEIDDFLRQLHEYAPKRGLVAYADTFLEIDYYNIDEIVALGTADAIVVAVRGVTSGNAAFLLKHAKAEMKRVDREIRSRRGE
ncbi:hypothetical protein DFH06DRAFT_1471807 [Mycena polygramma]|nr:hypothetical protein DFH06DRAFT_1471807 [Mycena polygramma]